MIEASFVDGQRLSVLVKQRQTDGGGAAQPTAAPEGQFEASGKVGDGRSACRRGGEQQFVVVTASELTPPSQHRVRARRQRWQLCDKNFGGDRRTLDDMTQVGEQPVRDVDCGVCQAAQAQFEPQFDTSAAG